MVTIDPASEVIESKTQLYWPQLDGLRALAFFLVFLEHQSPIPLTPQVAAIPGVQVLGFLCSSLFRWGWIGVDMFFVLSAYLITTLLLSERQAFGQVAFKQFMIRRILRIWPLYFIIVLLGFFILPAMHYYQFPIQTDAWRTMTQFYLPAYLIFGGNFLLGNPQAPAISFLLGILWSVSMEEQFYLCWGALMSKIKRMALLFLIPILGLPLTLLVRLSIFNQTHQQKAYYFNTFAHLDPILIGILIALLLHIGKIPSASLKKLGPILFTLPIIFLLILALFFPPLETSHISTVFVFTGVAFAAGMFLLAVQHWTPAQRLFSLSPLVWLGRLSFGLYVFHPLGKDLGNIATYALYGSASRSTFAQQVTWAWFCYFSTSLLFTMLLAWLSWHLLEKRFHRLRKRFMRIPSGGT